MRSFGEDTRFDCLQSLQIERSGRNYTFYMNDRLLCVIRDSELTGGSIGYIAKGAEASFGFIGGTGAVGGNGAVDQFKTVSEQAGLIPATQALEAYPLVMLNNGQKSIVAKEGDLLSYRILVADNGTYDLSVLCHGIGADGIGIELRVDGKTIATASLSYVNDGTATLIHRGIQLTTGQHVLSVKFQESVSVEKLCLLKSAPTEEISLDYASHADEHRFSDGAWEIADGFLTMTGSSSYGKRLYGAPNMGDYTVEVTMTPKTIPNCGLLVRATHPGSPNFLNTSSTEQDAATATDWVKGYFIGFSSEGVIIGKQSYGYREVARADGQFRPNTAYTLKVICEGARIQVYVDGKLYLDYIDPDPFMQGMIGVRTHNCSVAFGGLTIRPNGGFQI